MKINRLTSPKFIFTAKPAGACESSVFSEKQNCQFCMSTRMPKRNPEL